MSAMQLLLAIRHQGRADKESRTGHYDETKAKVLRWPRTTNAFPH